MSISELTNKPKTKTTKKKIPESPPEPIVKISIEEEMFQRLSAEIQREYRVKYGKL